MATQVIDKAKARIRMTDDALLEIEFDRCAGAGFGATGISSFSAGTENKAYTDSLPLLAWLLVSEALARNDDPARTWGWVTDQLRLVTSWHLSLYELVCRHMAACWSAPLPIILYGPEDSAKELWDKYHQIFPTTDQKAIRTLLEQVFARYGRSLFQPGDWKAEIKQDSKYATPDRASIVKLGLTLKDLAENTEGEDRMLFEEWQRTLRESVLHRLPAHIGRGFAPATPVFEDLVLAILAVAEWLPLPHGWKIAESVQDMDRNANERLTPDQQVFAGALYGWIQGYHSVGNWIENPAQRSALSRQAICQAMKRASSPEDRIDLASKVVLYGSPSGSLSELLQPYIRLVELKHQESHTARPESVGVIISAHDAALIDIAQGTFHMQITVSSG
jgi:hypothetical protein